MDTSHNGMGLEKQVVIKTLTVGEEDDLYIKYCFLSRTFYYAKLRNLKSQCQNMERKQQMQYLKVNPFNLGH